jgi:protocatechuate 3,4-dioxygenase beta subunit
MSDEKRFSRRATLAKLGGLLAGAGAVGGWKLAQESSAGPEAVARGLVSCVLAPEQTEGPFFLDDQLLRRNITEGRPGIPLTLRLRILDVSSCRPIRNAAVDVWHCDAGGVYSGVQGDSGTFMRGIQRTDTKGFAVFRTVYPGWYQGRTVHIHVKVALGGNVVHTGQLYFPEAVTDAVYRHSPYSRRPGRTTRNAADSIYRNGGRRSTLKLTRSGTGYVAAIAMGVQR